MNKRKERDAAIAAGLDRYFTGKPCKSGHLADRMVFQHRCIECLKIWKERSNAKMGEYIKRCIALDPLGPARRQKEYRKRHPERMRVEWSKRWAVKKKAVGSHTVADIERIFKLQKNKCAYCKCRLTKHHIDHIVPLSRGGSHNKENIQLLCPRCNMSKSAKDPIQFAQQLGMLL
jgi:5-methylcytosine-specific restriction endonuclease McrA